MINLSSKIIISILFIISGCSYYHSLGYLNVNNYSRLVSNGYIGISKTSDSPEKYSVTIEKLRIGGIDTSTRSSRVTFINNYFYEKCRIEKENSMTISPRNKKIYMIDVICE